MAPLKKEKGPPEMTYGSQICPDSPKVLHGTQGDVVFMRVMAGVWSQIETILYIDFFKAGKLFL